MNVLLWILQGGLALLLFAGGAYKLFTREELARQFGVLSLGAWGAFGVVEMVGAILLIVPAAANWAPTLTPLAAAVIAVESSVLAVVYSRTSRALSVSNPLVFAVAMGLVAAFVAYGRYVVSPIG